MSLIAGALSRNIDLNALGGRLVAEVRAGALVDGIDPTLGNAGVVFDAVDFDATFSLVRGVALVATSLLGNNGEADLAVLFDVAGLVLDAALRFAVALAGPLLFFVVVIVVFEVVVNIGNDVGVDDIIAVALGL